MCNQPTGSLFDGLRVVEAATMVMVPSVGAIFADYGADVIKVEPPGGDLNRRGHQIPGMPVSELEYCYLQCNRNKRSVVLDLKEDPDLDAFRRLVASADVFLTNYRQSALTRLGIDWPTLEAINPGLIYAHGTGYGDRGEESTKPGFDAVCYWSRSALEATIFPLEGWLGSLPYGSGDHPSGMSLYAAVMTALFRRHQTGKGGRVSTSLIANGAWSNSIIIQARLAEAEFLEPRPRAESRNFAAVYYKSACDRVFKFTIVDHPGTWPRLCRAVGREEWIEDPRTRDMEARGLRMPQLIAELDLIFRQRDIEHWASAFERHDVPFSLLSDYDEVVLDPQMQANGVFLEYDDPEYGPLRSVNNPLQLDGTDQVTPRTAPRLGEHTEEVLREIGQRLD